ncbi:hypothetical protein FB45DRAFT_807591 [Roridomyces roridus]|uniref:DUF7223 domain-containing protein n=1 Tax=Roridomyces roridus TaxID=1738132 RepID=A0AAD7B0T4_9AGAR|nr:hypothetical protein FB45DRAFT_807591 [Roridomyces roridus]
MLPFLLASVLGSLAQVIAAHTACKGDCTYHISNSTVSASLTVSGASHAVSDITPAGGWSILSCDADSLAQEIRLVCSTAACEHLFEGQGAIDTVVLLPDTCAAGGFARVADVRIDIDQKVPKSVSSMIEPGGNVTSTVFVLSVDRDFAATDVSKTGPVSFNIATYNSPSESKRSIVERDNTTLAVNLPPIAIHDTFPLVTASINCQSFTASISAGFTADIHANASLGLIVAGTVIPPEITQFEIFAGLDASVGGTLDVLATATGPLSTGKISLYSVALTGVNFPGILSLGPTFTIYGEIDANIDADLAVSVDLAYNLQNAKLTIPVEDSPKDGSVTPANSALTLSVLPNINSNATVNASIIPELSVGINAFTFITAEVYLNVIGTASVGLDLNASADAKVSTDGSVASGSVDGCVDVGAAFSTNVGADGSLFNFISGSVNYPLFSDSWDLYKKCFAAAGSTNASRRAAVPVPVERRATGLMCPTSASNITSIEQIIDQVITDIKAAV